MGSVVAFRLRKPGLTLVVGLVLCAALAVPAGAKELHWAGCGITKKAFMQELADAYEKKSGVKIVLEGGGATRGIRDTAGSRVDIGGSCRLPLGDPSGLRPHPEERGIDRIPIAWDALVVIVHKDNPVDSLTLRQVRDLYSGRYRNWAQLGGSDSPIELYVRRGKISGVGRTVRELVFGDPAQEFPGWAIVANSSGPLEKAIESTPYAVGITGVSSARRRDVKMLALQGVEPSYDNIKSGQYLLYRPLYMIVRRDNRDPALRGFVSFAMSTEARDIMRGLGTVPFVDAPWLLLKQAEELHQALWGGVGEQDGPRSD